MNSLGVSFSKLIKLFKEGIWLAIVPLFFPLYLVKFDFLGLPLNILEAVIFLLFAIWLVFRTLLTWQNWKITEDKRFWWKQIGQRNWRFGLISSLFMLISFIAVWKVPGQTTLIDGHTVYESKKVALGILKGWIVMPYLYFVMLWYSATQKSTLFKSLYAYVFSALPLVIWAVSQYISGHFITSDGRASGPFINANYLAMYLAPAVVALWILIVRGILLGFKLPRFLIGAFLAVFYSIALLMTQSYGAMLAVVITLTFFVISAYFLHKRFVKDFELRLIKKIAYFLLTILFVVLFAATLLFVKTEKWRLFTEINSRSSSAVRLEVYDVAWALVKQNPVLGIGFGQFEPLYNLKSPEILGQAPYEWTMIHPHNSLLAIWLNLGIAGLLLFLGLILMVFRKYWLAASYSQKFYRLIGLSMFLVMLLHGMVDTYLFKNDLAMLFWLVIALCFLPRKFVVEGVVVEGAKIGRKIGFPTANLKILRSNLDMGKLNFGVYGVVVWFKGKRYLGAMSFGTRPTVDDNSQPTFEVYIFDFDEEIYGQVLKVEVAAWIRAIFKFKDLEELKVNLQNDLKLVQSKIRI